MKGDEYTVAHTTQLINTCHTLWPYNKQAAMGLEGGKADQPTFNTTVQQLPKNMFHCSMHRGCRWHHKHTPIGFTQHQASHSPKVHD